MLFELIWINFHSFLLMLSLLHVSKDKFIFTTRFTNIDLSKHEQCQEHSSGEGEIKMNGQNHFYSFYLKPGSISATCRSVTGW